MWKSVCSTGTTMEFHRSQITLVCLDSPLLVPFGPQTSPRTFPTFDDVFRQLVVHSCSLFTLFSEDYLRLPNRPWEFHPGPSSMTEASRYLSIPPGLRSDPEPDRARLSKSSWSLKDTGDMASDASPSESLPYSLPYSDMSRTE